MLYAFSAGLVKEAFPIRDGDVPYRQDILRFSKPRWYSKRTN